MGEINPLIGQHPSLTRTLEWDDPELRAITRIRFIGDSWHGPFDLSYCHGLDTDGSPVRVRIPTYQVCASGAYIVTALVADAKRSGVYLKRLCGGDISDVLSVCW
jgi:hypothetical protein